MHRPFDEVDEDDEERTGLLVEEGRGGEAAKAARHGPQSRRRDADGVLARLGAALVEPLRYDSPGLGCLQRCLVYTPEEEEHLSQLRQLASVMYDSQEPLHERELRRFFAAVRSPAEARSLPAGKDPRWKELGFQAEDPRTDFRGGGLLALQNMCFLAETYPDKVEAMIRESRREPEYLFSAACVNISAMCVLALGLNERPGMSPARSMPVPMNAVARTNFARVLAARLSAAGRDASAKEAMGELFSCLVVKLHAEWKAVCDRKPNATMLDFGQALESTAVSLERLLGSLKRPRPESTSSSTGPDFAVIDLINPARLTTIFWNKVVRCSAVILGGMCHLGVFCSQLVDECCGFGGKKGGRHDV